MSTNERMSEPRVFMSSSSPTAEAVESAPPHTATADDARSWDWVEASPKVLAMALGFGLVFGFLLQKGGVAKFDILIGVLLLENFVVVKVMLTAIIVGMVGVLLLRKTGLLETKISETRLAANAIGGLIFGVGFGLLAYCPGTNAAAVGQGNLDALVGVVGLLAGSYAYALSSRLGTGKIGQWGNRGKITWPEVLNVSPTAFVLIAAPIMVAGLVALEWLTA